MPDFTFEDAAAARGMRVVVGVDEAGRGPWAGPVVAGAVVLDRGALPARLRDGLDDSKKLSAARRETLFAELAACARIGVGVAEVAEIDTFNILRATLMAMARAVAALGAPAPDFALVDGNRPPILPCGLECVVKGDGRSLSIAAASIVAKVTRDRAMAALAREHPGFGWERNAGYGTPEHIAALARLGPTPHHRRSFRPVAALLRRR